MEKTARPTNSGFCRRIPLYQFHIHARTPRHGASMHPPSEPASQVPPSSTHWTRQLNRYHWFVFVVAALGWLFDTMDQQLFTLARVPAMRELIQPIPGEEASQRNARIAQYAGNSTSIFLIGWATGGIAFGIMGDRYGRVKTMLLTILVYSIFTGLSALSVGFWDFALWRFLTGLGVGGEFAVGISLVAEAMPDRARPYALGLLQACSAIGNVTAAFISMTGISWRLMFLIGTAPALLTLFVRRRLREPERWQAATMTEGMQKQLGSFRELFGNTLYRKHALLGLVLASSGVIGLWGIGFFAVDLNRIVFRPDIERPYREAQEPLRDQGFLKLLMHDQALAERAAQQLTVDDWLDAPGLSNKQDWQLILLHHRKPHAAPAADWEALQSRLQQASAPAESGEALLQLMMQRSRSINHQLSFWSGITALFLNVGGFFGIYLFSVVSHYLGRRATFALCFLLALLGTALVYWYLGRILGFADIFWMVPIMGFCQLSLFGGYAVYFPELFPTRLRSTGTSFCYNIGRFVAALGPYTLGLLTSRVFVDLPLEPMRYAGVVMSGVFLIGMLALPFLPETKDKPLPE